jgi:hypothetical protein
MAAENQPPAIEEISFKEAVGLVGKKPDGSERKDLITDWGFGKKRWRWCIDVKMTLEDAIKIHQMLAEQVKVVADKKKESKKKKD